MSKHIPSLNAALRHQRARRLIGQVAWHARDRIQALHALTTGAGAAESTRKQVALLLDVLQDDLNELRHHSQGLGRRQRQPRPA